MASVTWPPALLSSLSVIPRCFKPWSANRWSLSITSSATARRTRRCQALSRADFVSGVPDSETRWRRCSGLIGMPLDRAAPTLPGVFREQGGHILDPFVGSGTTLVAAEAEGHNWTGVGITSDYYQVAHSRLAGA
ncbi:TPA: hypothetical protein UMB92_003683 [Stenotrophomonas maltophilia]|nr:hypothetical protein [Stenotrophomonas maltophilia]